jgi:hypothetical protein
MIDFGDVQIGKEIESQFKVTNVSTRDVTFDIILKPQEDLSTASSVNNTAPLNEEWKNSK